MSKTMRPQKQKLGHDPDQGIYGDCYRTALAVILGIGAEEVPHFCDPVQFPDDFGVKEARKWLKSFGLGVYTVPYHETVSWAELMHTIGHCNSGSPVIVIGEGAGGENHAVAVLDGEIFCNPDTGNGGGAPLRGPSTCVDGGKLWWVEIVTFQPEVGS